MGDEPHQELGGHHGDGGEGQTTSVNTLGTRLPTRPGDPGQVGPSRAPSGLWRLALAALALALVLALVLGVTLVEAPYLAISPGSAVEVGPLIAVADEHVRRAEGQIDLITVRLAPVTVVGALRGWLDPAVEVVGRDRVAPARIGAEELRVANLAQMDTSQQHALGVAFEALGHDAISGAGAEVVQAVAGSPADGALVAGDAIVGFDGTPVATHGDVVRALRDRRPGSSIDLVVEAGEGRGPRVVTLRLGEHPDEPGAPLLGATLRTRAPRFDLPFEVDIASEHIGGPSAGLAFTLELLDLLSAGELTGGRRVAATGTIELDGSVGAVGAIAQKTAVAEREGIELLLVPGAEIEEARRLAGDRLTVEPVDTLADALRVLIDHGGDPLVPLP